ncbi:MAG: UDP-2,4-diacetamido-2,4,6-trideoxy-beta-L-altropyranose hydrolase [Balneolaceae bacterium]|nr:UDP-2,4-diacetamido-2,4,6-trideoxy-beta-L-altropyranose hydrolase [Balneolaceae bacterium]
MKSDLFIRADGSSEMGLGHLVRCTSLSIILKDQFRITFVCKKIPQQIEAELKQRGLSIVKIDQEEEFFDRLTSEDTVVLDGYFFDTAYQKKIKELGSSLVFIDDLHDREFYADLIINHAPGISKEDYSAQPYTRYALGLDYVLLRPPFLEAARSAKEKNRNLLNTILICFGGSDIKNLTIRAAKVALDFNQFKKIIIITGSAYKYQNELLQVIQHEEKIVHYHALSGKKMATVFQESDVAIVPSSGILFEALATGNITISGTYIDNQQKMYSGFKELNAIVDAGEFSAQEIRNAMQQIEPNKKPKSYIDGKSPERIRSLFKSLKKD